MSKISDLAQLGRVRMPAAVDLSRLGPRQSGPDQTNELNNWLNANRGRVCQLNVTTRDNPFRVAGLKLPTATRILGSACGPFSLGNDGTYIAPVKGFSGELARGEPLDTKKNWWSHGTIIEGIGWFGEGTASVGLRFCGGEVSAIRDCAFNGFSAAGLKLVGGNAPFYSENLSFYLNQSGVWIYNSGGAMGFSNFGGDDNHSLMRIENSDDDPNGSGGRIVAISIGNLKVETGTMLNQPGAAALSNRPIFDIWGGNNGSLAVFGGYVADWSGPPFDRIIAKINARPPSNPDQQPRSMYLSFQNLKVDNFPTLISDDVRGVTKDIAALTSWAPPPNGAFTPIYHDHGFERTKS